MIKRIVKNGFCVGCGLCQSVLGNDNCKIKLFDNGFYYPVITHKTVNDGIVRKICPGIRVNDNRKHGAWGYVKEVAEAWSTNKQLRFKAASGGVSSALATYLIEKGLVDGILQTGLKGGSFLYNELKISRTKEDIYNNAQSRYAPSLTLSNFKQVLDSSNDTYAFIGKPCDIAGIKNFMKVFPQYKNRIKFTISIFCAGMPSYNATKKVWEQSGRTDSPVYVKYRGEGWPGNFKAVWQDGSKYEISYNDSWGKVLGRDLGLRCKICPDGIGMLADIAVGDSWNTKNGYPDFAEAEGRNFCFIRTKAGSELFNAAKRDGYIEGRELDESKVKDMQAYQYDRRHMAAWRIIAANLMSFFMLNFKGLGLIALAKQSNKKRGIKEIIGTIKRMVKNKKKIKKLYNTKRGGVERKDSTTFYNKTMLVLTKKAA